MSVNKTPIRKIDPPRFGMYEAAYFRESAIKGFLEAAVIARIRFDGQLNTYKYQWLKDRKLASLIRQNGKVSSQFARPAKKNELSPFEVREEELLTFCEAIPIQVRYLERELEEAEDELGRVCGSDGDEVLADQETTDLGNLAVGVPAPRFGINEVVYFADSAQIGHLEKMRIQTANFDPASLQWIYSARFKQKPGANATVGDRIDLRRSVVVSKAENNLLTACEAIPLRIQFLVEALNTSRRRQSTHCP